MKLSGILLIDKDVGISSNTALHIARRLLGANKAGHAGTLDPLASGALPIALGEATKTCTFMLDADKAYRTRAQLGVRTSTGDADGEVIARAPVPVLSSALVEVVLQKFRGVVEQIPPMYSALKHQGKALYQLAREGIEIERAPRSVCIRELRCLDMGPDWIDLELTCSTGTYVRTLVEDIGSALGCGAFVSSLRRLWVAPFESWPLYRLDDLGPLSPVERRALLAPIDAGIMHLPLIELDSEQSARYFKGIRVQVKAPAGPVRVYGDIESAREILAIGEVFDDGRLAITRMLKEVKHVPNPARRVRERQKEPGLGD
jgi:tRNA pseudouridine55 synthase